jgi:hypothetical protein
MHTSGHFSPSFSQITNTVSAPHSSGSSTNHSSIRRNRKNGELAGSSHSHKSLDDANNGSSHHSRRHQRLSGSAGAPPPPPKSPTRSPLFSKKGLLTKLGSLSPKLNTHKQKVVVEPMEGFWPDSLPINLMEDQHLKIIPSSGGDNEWQILLVQRDEEDKDSQDQDEEPADAASCCCCFVERQTETATIPHSTTPALDNFNFWADKDRTVLIGTVNEIEAPVDPSVPVQLRGRERHYRMHSTKPVFDGQAKTRHRRPSNEQEKPLQQRALPNDINIYHCGDISSRSSGLLGRQLKHHMKFHHPQQPKTWANYSFTQEQPHQQQVSTTTSTVSSSPPLMIIKRDRQACAQVRAPAPVPSSSSAATTTMTMTKQIRVLPRYDPMVLSMFLAIALPVDNTNSRGQ